MSRIFLKSETPTHFLVDDKGDLYQVSEFLAEQHKALHPRTTVAVDHIDKETNTIWFSAPLPAKVKV